MGQTERRVNTDVLVIGSGPAGSTYARLLALSGRNVTLIDTGAQFGPKPGVHLKNAYTYQRNVNNFVHVIQGLLHPISVPTSGDVSRTLDPVAFRPHDGIRNAMNPRQKSDLNLDSAAAAYSVGGMALHWTGAVPRHHPTMERIQFIGNNEWDDIYSIAEELLNKHTDVYEDSIRNTIVKQALAAHYHILPKDYQVQNLPMAAERRSDNDEFVYFTGTDRILGAVTESSDPSVRSRLTILPHHQLKRLFSGDGGRISHAEVYNLMEYSKLEVHADTFIVAAGTVMNAQILWASDIRHEALGRYLIEHPIAFTQIVLKRELVEETASNPKFAGRLTSKNKADPVPIPMHDPPPNVWIPISEGRPWHCQIHKDAFHYGALPADIDDRLVVDLRWFAIIEPRYENRVWFEPDIWNEFGMPQPTFEFQYSRADGQRMHDMMSDMVEAAQVLGGILPGAEPRFMPSGLCLHIQGTCRMGTADDGTSVVDSNSRVWGYENLYIGGNAVIPTANGSNPTLTNVALAVKSARSIIK